jgi:hypothetical protein
LPLSHIKTFESATDISLQLLQDRERTQTSGLAVRFGCFVDRNMERNFRSEIEAYLPATRSQMTTSIVSEFFLVACNKCTTSHKRPYFVPSSTSFYRPAPLPISPLLFLPVQASLDQMFIILGAVRVLVGET